MIATGIPYGIIAAIAAGGFFVVHIIKSFNGHYDRKYREQHKDEFRD